MRAALGPFVRCCARLLVAAGASLSFVGCYTARPAEQSLSQSLLADYTLPMVAESEPSAQDAHPAALQPVDTSGVLDAPGPGVTDTLQSALASAYLVNPDLNAERAKLRATDEQVGVAKSGMRPTITATGDTAYDNTHTSINGNDPAAVANFGPNGDVVSDGVTNPRGYALGLTQPIFEGFQNLNAVRQAKASVQAGRESLRTVEQTVLLTAITAYADVVRDQAIVRLRENNVTVLTEQRAQTRGQFKLEEVTRTDLAQAEARLSGAIAFLNAAQANLKASRATYEQVIGNPPGKLDPPPSIFSRLPRTLDDAMSLADGENPAILDAVYQEEASLYQVNQIMGELLPTVTLEAQYQQRYDLSKAVDGEEDTTVTGRVSVPLYQGGGVAARIRQAKQTNTQRKRLVESARLSAHSNVLANWGILQSSAAEIESAKAAVASNKIALEGNRQEQKVGQRTTLDVLNAQLELLDSEIALVNAVRDRVVAEYALAAAIGRLDAQSLGLSTPYYDPNEHYDDTKNSWAGLRPPAPPAPDN